MLKGLFVLLILMPTVLAMQGEPKNPMTLSYGESRSFERYTLELMEFGGSIMDEILLRVLEDNYEIGKIRLREGEIRPIGDINIGLDKVRNNSGPWEEPLADVWIQYRADPHPKVNLTFAINKNKNKNKNTFLLGEDIYVDFKVDNNGTEEVKDLALIFESEPNIKFIQNYTREFLKPNDYWPGNRKQITAIYPYNLNQEAVNLPCDLNLRAALTYRNSDGKKSIYSNWINLRINSALRFYKEIDKLDKNISYQPSGMDAEALLINETCRVRNVLINEGDKSIKIKLSDKIASCFRAEPKLDWNLKLSPGEKQEINYSIQAKDIAGYSQLPPATAIYFIGDKPYRSLSNIPDFEVRGAQLTPIKEISPMQAKVGEKVRVSLGMKNTGNLILNVRLKQIPPESSKLVDDCELNDSFRIPGNSNWSTKYELVFLKPGSIEIPASELTYKDAYNESNTIKTETLRIEVLENNSTNDNLTQMNSNVSEGFLGEFIGIPLKLFKLFAW